MSIERCQHISKNVQVGVPSIRQSPYHYTQRGKSATKTLERAISSGNREDHP